MATQIKSLNTTSVISWVVSSGLDRAIINLLITALITTLEPPSIGTSTPQSPTETAILNLAKYLYNSWVLSDA